MDAANAQRCRVSILLEETGLPYEPHLVSFETNDQMTPGFPVVESNNKIPAIIDPDGPGGKPLPLWETSAILIYLAEKTGKFIPQDAARRYESIQWVMWQMGGVRADVRSAGFFSQVCRQDYGDKRP